MDIYMVHITLCAIKKQTLSVVQCFFYCLAQKTGPVGGDFAAAYHVGMVAEVNQHQAVIFPVKAQYVHPLVHIADRMQNVRVIYTGIGAHRSVLHAKTPHKGNIRRIANTITHRGRPQIINGQLGNICKLPLNKLCILNLQRLCGVIVQKWASMGVGGMDVNSFPGKTGYMTDLVYHGV